MANDSDPLFPSGPTTRRGLLSAFSRRAADAVPIPDVLLPRGPVERDELDHFEEVTPDHIEPVLSGEQLIAEIRASEEDTGMHIWWLGQSGFLVQVADECILFDPYLSDSLTTKYAGTGYAARTHHRTGRRAVAPLVRQRRHVEPRPPGSPRSRDAPAAPRRRRGIRLC